MSFKDKFETFVLEIAEEAKLQATSFADRIEALKVLNQSYALMRKYPDKEDDEDDSFNFAKAIAEEPATNGTAKVRNRPGGH